VWIGRRETIDCSGLVARDHPDLHCGAYPVQVPQPRHQPALRKIRWTNEQRGILVLVRFDAIEAGREIAEHFADGLEQESTGLREAHARALAKEQPLLDEVLELAYLLADRRLG
jgi:hypothetical protein